MSDNSHAAMCVYCGKAVIYDTRQVTDMEAAHRQIVEHDQQCPKNPLVKQVDTMEAAVYALFGYLSEQHPDAAADVVRVFAGTTWEQVSKRLDGLALVPREISAATGHKAGMIGDFNESVEVMCSECEQDDPDPDCGECGGEFFYQQDVPVSWTTIKAIHKRIVEIAETPK